MIRRYREILSIILNTDGYVTTNELADFCGVSVRTIQLDIKKINNQLKEYEVKIDQIVKKGYFFSDESKKLLIENDILRSIFDYEYIKETPTTPIDRQIYIILKLTVEDYIDIEELGQQLFVSSSTLYNDINNAKKWLKEHLQLNISVSLSKGLSLKCSEKEKRNIISWILGKKIRMSLMSKYWNYMFCNKDVMNYFNEIYNIVNAVGILFNYNLAGNSCQLFCIEILIAMQRAEQGYRLEEFDVINIELKPVMVTLRERIEIQFNIELSKFEWLNLQQYFTSKQFNNGTVLSLIKTEEAVDILNDFFRIINYKFDLALSSYNVLRDNLLLYIPPMINRLRLNHCIGNPIHESITEVYPLEFKIAKEMSYIIKERLSLNLKEIDLAYITMHLVSTNEYWGKKLNVAIVCDYDESIINFIKNKVFKHCDENFKFFRCYTYQQFIFESKEKLKEIDFIITTSTLADKTNIPFIQITHTLDSKDIKNLYKHLDSLKDLNKIKKE